MKGKYLTQARREMRLTPDLRRKFLDFTSDEYFDFISENSEYYGNKDDGYEYYGYDYGGNVVQLL